jgi:hypothetical protein
MMHPTNNLSFVAEKSQFPSAVQEQGIHENQETKVIEVNPGEKNAPQVRTIDNQGRQGGILEIMPKDHPEKRLSNSIKN